MKKSLLDKLKAYSLSAGAFAAGTSAQAQVMYTNVEPDSATSGIGSSYDLDLNNDGTVDFILDIAQSTNYGYFTFTGGFFYFNNAHEGVQISPQGSNRVLGNWPQALNTGMIVQDQIYGWYNYSNMNLARHADVFSSFQFSSYYGSTFSGSYSWSYSGGNFLNTQDKYIGLRVVISGDTHYGWARLDVDSVTSFVLKDYAIELTPDKFIFTGDTGLILHASPAQAVAAADVSNFGNGNDIQVQFAAGANESTVGLYRLIAVKEAVAAGFTLADAQTVPSSCYFPMAPNGSPVYTQNLYAGMRDSDGDFITTGVPYKIFVHTEANTSVAINDALSQPSDTVVLEELIALEPVQAVSAFDVGNKGNGLDLEVNFNKIAFEGNLQEYRVFITKSANAGAFGLSDAETNTNFLGIAPTGQNISTVLTNTSRDTDGDLIKNNVPYRAFVMSVADGLNATDNFLSPASNEVTLNNTVGIETPSVSDHLLVAYTGNGVSVSTRDGSVFRSAEIRSLDGKLLRSETMNQNELRLDNGQFATGAYFVRLTDKNNSYLLKVLIP